MSFIISRYFKSHKTRSKVGSPQRSGSTTANPDRGGPAQSAHAASNIDSIPDRLGTQSGSKLPGTRSADINRNVIDSSRSTPGLLRLPPEILLMISTLLTQFHDLNSLILTHPRLAASALSTVLYQRAISPSGYGGAYLLRDAVTNSVHSRMRILLTSYGIDPNTAGRRGQTLLHTAVSNSDITSARILLEAGINVNATDSTRTTALHLASRSGNAEMISLLASHHANLEAVDSEGRTPFHRVLDCSSNESRIAAVSASLRFGANPNVFVRLPRTSTTPALGWSPLHSAAVDCPDSQTMIRLLVEYGADLEQPLLNTDPPCTPLALVAEFLVWFHLEHAEATHRSLAWFRSKHANATHQNLVREYDEHWKAVELLLELGADIEPALLAMNQRPNLGPRGTNIGNQHPVFLYRSVLPDRRTKVHEHNRRSAPLIPEDRWEMASKCVKEGLERARDRVRGSKSIFQKITILTCNLC